MTDRGDKVDDDWIQQLCSQIFAVKISSGNLKGEFLHCYPFRERSWIRSLTYYVGLHLEKNWEGGVENLRSFLSVWSKYSTVKIWFNMDPSLDKNWMVKAELEKAQFLLCLCSTHNWLIYGILDCHIFLLKLRHFRISTLANFLYKLS